MIPTNEQFELLIAAYLSGQVSEAEWTAHLKDKELVDYLAELHDHDLIKRRNWKHHNW